MDINFNHPNFVVFLDNVTTTINFHVTIEGYFTLNQEKKLGTQFIVLKYIKTSLRIKGKLTDNELKLFITLLCKHNEETENYELAAILNDIVKNFDSINEKTNTTKSASKSSKVDEKK